MTARKLKKIAIVGTANSVTKAPFNDQSWLIWTLPGARKACPRFDGLFEIHNFEELEERQKEMLVWLRGLPGDVPVFMREKHADIKGSVAYPEKRIRDNFPPDVLTSSMAWAFAKALEVDKADVVGLWGVHSENGLEYVKQRVGLRILMDMAKRNYGREVILPPDSPLNIDPSVYGFDDPTPEMKAAVERHRKMEARAAEIAKQTSALADEAAYIRGALDASSFNLQNFMAPPPGSFYDN